MTDDSDPQEPELEGHTIQSGPEILPTVESDEPCVPVEDLGALADEWIQQRTGNAEVDQAYEYAGSRLYRLIAEYRGDNE